MKIIAFYLPQFHNIPENDEWWGDGFTEWTNVKKAKPLFDGHEQPLIPLNNNYYNLLEKETVVWQTKLMNEYGVDGMIYYHYYFCGKKLLEKPAENLLKDKTINQPFFFCWANHSWIRSWNGTSEVLVEQKYGTENDWKEHFEYLLQFFKDERYEKRKNKPLLMIFKSDFPEKNAMLDYFNTECIKHGFDGICIIETYHGQSYPNGLEELKNNKSKCTEFIFLREPAMALTMYIDSIKYKPKWINMKLKEFFAKKKLLSYVRTYDGNTLYDIMLNYKIESTLIPGVFFQWDNTPRHSFRGYIISSPEREKFNEYIKKIKGCEYLFINAWNEWAEGMILEPTEQNKFKYLEWIRDLDK